MTQNSTKISPRQQRAIEALLTERTLQDAARQGGVSRRTLYRWLKQPEFINALREALDSRRNLAVAQLEALLEASLEVLANALRGQDARLALRAALGLLGHYDSLAEFLDLAQRVAMLEQKIVGGEHGNQRKN